MLAPFLVAPFAPALARYAPRAAGWILGLVPAALFVLLARHVPAVADGVPFREGTPWVPELGIALAFNADGFGLLFALLISGIGTLVLIYGGGYLAGDRDIGRFYAFLLLFMGSMLGIVLADDLIALFVFWELTSLTSFFLIGYHHEDPVSRRNALQALLVTAAGGLSLLAGALLLSGVTGTMRISAILEMGDLVRGHAFYVPILVLFLAGAFTKSAQFPFHFWLPNAMAAPTPVSAYLHSATMVKAGVYLLARMNPALGGTEVWTLVLVLVGATTMVLGAYLAMRHVDFKLILAYTTLSALGTLVLLVGIGTSLAAKGLIVFLLAHALYKGAFFLVAGAVDHETGTRDVRRLGGLARLMPFTMVAAVLAALGLAGIAPTFSFIAKETLLEAALHNGLSPYLVTGAVAFAGVLFVAVALRLAYRPFFGPPGRTPKSPHEAPLSMLIGPVLLGLSGVVLGLAPRLAPQKLIATAASVVHGDPVEVKLTLFHGLTPALLLSLGIVLLGVLVYLARAPIDRALSRIDPLARWGPESQYHRAIAGLFHLANWQTRRIQTTHIRHYFTVILLVATFASGFTLLWRHGLPVLPAVEQVVLHEAIVIVMIIAGALFTAVARSRLTAIISLGLVGYGVALLFILFSAPDLALTQFLFETLIVLLFTFVLLRMPGFIRRSKTSARLRDAAIGVLVGALATTFTLLAYGTDLHAPISEYFGENSYLLAHGRNVVNVILVDFRGLDTLGEIVVIAVAAVGAYALLGMRQRGEAATDPGPEQEGSA